MPEYGTAEGGQPLRLCQLSSDADGMVGCFWIRACRGRLEGEVGDKEMTAERHAT